MRQSACHVHTTVNREVRSRGHTPDPPLRSPCPRPPFVPSSCSRLCVSRRVGSSSFKPEGLSIPNSSASRARGPFWTEPRSFPPATATLGAGEQEERPKNPCLSVAHSGLQQKSASRRQKLDSSRSSTSEEIIGPSRVITTSAASPDRKVRCLRARWPASPAADLGSSLRRGSSKRAWITRSHCTTTPRL